MKKRPPKKQKIPLLKNPKFFTTLIGTFIVLIMVGSALNMWKGKENVYEIKNLKFYKTDQGYTARIGNSFITILNDPKGLENITIQETGINKLNSLNKIYFSIDPTIPGIKEAVYEFRRNIPLRPIVVEACNVDIKICSELPLKDCKDATDTIGIIVFKKSNESKVIFENNCLKIEGKKELTKLVDKIIIDYYLK